MNKFFIIWVLAGICVMTSCTSQKKIEPEDEFAVDVNSAKESAGAANESDLSLDEPVVSKDNPDASQTAGAQDLSLENELNNLDAIATKKTEPQSELTLDAPEKTEAPVTSEVPIEAPVVEPEKVIAEQVVVEPVIETPAPSIDVPVPPVAEVAVETVAPVVPVQEALAPANISSLTYQGNDSGGAISITADQPLKYTSRVNSATNQFIIEIENSFVPKKLKRSLNTKDMSSSIGSVDIYQKQGSNISRFVVQLRPGAAEPMIQPEGNTLLILGAANSDLNKAEALSVATKQDLANSSIDGKAFATGEEQEFIDLTTDGIMSSDNLEEFLISNNKYYGKKLSIITDKMDIKDAIKFIADESGVNMIIDETVEGKITLKLKNVPWDQALILLLKTKKLGFKRQGSVLRIGKIDDFKKDEEEAISLKEKRSAKLPLVVKRFFIGYADINDLEKKIGQYLTAIDVEQEISTTEAGSTDGKANSKAQVTNFKKKEVLGKVISDKRSNSLIITDTEVNMLKITKIIEALDTQPQQILIESKVVEAKEEFTRGLGVNWNGPGGSPFDGNVGRINTGPALIVSPVTLNSSITWGDLDLLGSLTARIQLGEREDKVRVLSSPRVAVLSSEKASISQTAGLLVPTTVTSGGVVTTTNEIVQVGVNLDVTPTASNEGTVTLDLNIKRSFLAQADSRAPDVRLASTKVIVKSGHTAVIGGIFESQSIEASSGVPGLKDIPILGGLFKGRREGKSKNELVIFVTPTILKPVVGSDKKTTDLK